MQGKLFVSFLKFFVFLIQELVLLNLIILEMLWNKIRFFFFFLEYRFIGHWMLIGILVELWVTPQSLIDIMYGFSCVLF